VAKNEAKSRNAKLFASKLNLKVKNLPYCNKPALTANIRLGWKRMAVAGTVAYYSLESITAVKCHKIGTWSLYHNFLQSQLLPYCQLCWLV